MKKSRKKHKKQKQAEKKQNLESTIGNHAYSHHIFFELLLIYSSDIPKYCYIFR